MKKTIDNLIKEHTEGYKKYTLKCSISDFKLLQRLLSGEYYTKDYPDSFNGNGMWKHQMHELTYGTVKFEHFELNVSRFASYDGEPEFVKVDEVDKMFWNSK